jgi:hypothetical protein
MEDSAILQDKDPKMMKKLALLSALSPVLFSLSLMIDAAPAVAAPSRSNIVVSGPACSGKGQSLPLLLIRDTRAAMGGSGGGGGEGPNGGGGGGSNSCWSACFSTYNACRDRGPKDICVSRMKTCLAICDRPAN